MFVHDGAVTPGPSCKCDITFFVKGRPKSARQPRDSTVAARSVQSVTVPSSRVSRECRSPGLRSPPFKNARFQHLDSKTRRFAQCSATPATVAATPPCSATPFQTQLSVRHLPGQGGARCDTKIFRGCSATPVLHLQNAIKSRKSAAARVARHV